MFQNTKTINSRIIHSFKAQLMLLLLFSLIFLSISAYLNCQNILQEFKKETEKEFTVIENYLTLSIANAKQVVHGLAFLLSKTSMQLEDIKIFELLHNFDPRFKKIQAIPFSSLVAIDNKNISIASSSNELFFFKSKDFSKQEYLKHTRATPFKTQISFITQDLYTKEEIIPLAIAITNNKKQFIGSLYAGISIKQLKFQLEKNLIAKFLYDIKIINNYDFVNNKNIMDIFKPINFFKYDKDFVLYKSLKNYPYIIRITINHQYIASKIIEKLKLYLEYISIFTIFALFLWIIVKKIYINPFRTTQNKLNTIPNELMAKIINQNNNQELLSLDESAPIYLSYIISCLVDELQNLYKKQESEQIKQQTQDIRSNIFHLMLIERHYSPLEKISTTSAATLYSNLLIKMIHEKYTTMSLNTYLRQAFDYCISYHHDLEIKLDLKADKDFTFKYTALTETIFHIFSFIYRTANFDDAPILVKAYFKNQETFPIIEIEGVFYEKAQTSLGWEYGVHFTYMSLFSVYVLARENNLYLNIQQIGEKMRFTLAASCCLEI